MSGILLTLYANIAIMIDTHSHIYDEAFSEDFEAVVLRAKEAGVEGLVLPGIDSECYYTMLETADRLAGFAFPCIGLHPTSIGEGWRKELQFVYDHFDDRKFYAIGEIGIDEYWSKDFLKEQMEGFEAQLTLAYEKDLPVIIHNREGIEEVIASIKRVNKPLRGVFHAYNGSYETCERFFSLGDFYIGIGGVVTYKNAHVAKTLERIPLERILLETDAPWLTPVPHRGERNESSYVKYTAHKIAEIMGVTFEEVDIRTTYNAKELFSLPL
ncbi:MAG: TatD family hydrolase [Bacteroidales bacterium]|nr:TatD family hydrolase [Bacteroidales bacterium]